MLTTGLTSSPMELDSVPGNSRSPSPMRVSPSPRLRPKQKLVQWRCKDLTVVHKQKGSVKLANQRFSSDELCDDSMYPYLTLIRKFIKSLPEYNTVANSLGSRQLAKKTRRSRNLTLVLDLDETLISSSTDPKSAHDFKITFEDSNDEPVILLGES
eukprot:TRINITY_DN9872_c0_g7_i1.p1 TRINITY_DN9872_c0_g7~~TRINITY_DN9872_c0_g7_i1.p1  ORF type:complete len:156 (+),score=7.17 TRINITY_DN9872_c0_g7_i1:196-663(+)